MTSAKVTYWQKATSPSVNDGRRGMVVGSLVIVMAVGSEDVNIHLAFKNLVN